MMNRQITWLAEREEEIEALYRSAANRFAAHPDLARFLLTLADQERELAGLLRQLPRPADEASAGTDLLCDPAARQKTGELLAASWQAVAAVSLSERAMLEMVVNLEFAEWHAVFPLALHWKGQNDRDFRQVLGEIEGHRKTIERYLLADPEMDDLYEAIHALAPLWKRRILILDDDPVIGRLLGIIMAPYGDLEVTTRADDALNHLRNRHFDVVISDVCMPEMDGIEFYRQAVTLDPDIREHFLFYTATNHLEHLLFITEHQIPTLKKPSPLNVIRETMSNLCS